MNLEIPLKIRLMPTNVPITQAELDGQSAQMKKPSRRVMIRGLHKAVVRWTFL
jgi:hypothetical protein